MSIESPLNNSYNFMIKKYNKKYCKKRLCIVLATLQFNKLKDMVDGVRKDRVLIEEIQDTILSQFDKELSKEI